MDDVPWIYVAMIFIAFISWVRSRLKAAAERRRELAEARRRPSNREEPSPYHDSPLESSARSDEQGTAESFEKMVERMIGIPETAPKEPVSKPPPLPSQPAARSQKSSAPVKTAGSLADEVGSFDVEVPDVEVPKAFRSQRKKRKDGRASGAFVNSLKGRNRIRNAFILKEVLDTPKGMS